MTDMFSDFSFADIMSMKNPDEMKFKGDKLYNELVIQNSLYRVFFNSQERRAQLQYERLCEAEAKVKKYKALYEKEKQKTKALLAGGNQRRRKHKP
jgi:hypothetical protein